LETKHIRLVLVVIPLVVIGVIALFSIVNNLDEKSCGQVVQAYHEQMKAVCPVEYLEWGYDTVEQCINDEMGSMPDPHACM